MLVVSKSIHTGKFELKIITIEKIKKELDRDII